MPGAFAAYWHDASGTMQIIRVIIIPKDYTGPRPHKGDNIPVQYKECVKTAKLGRYVGHDNRGSRFMEVAA